jgi:FkbM family methyltransferase
MGHHRSLSSKAFLFLFSVAHLFDIASALLTATRHGEELRQSFQDYCRKLVMNAKPFPRASNEAREIFNSGSVPFDPREHSPTFLSQFGQDYFFYVNHLQLLPPARSHFYVDLAANDARSISNTWFLDLCSNWRGLCIEPQPRYFSNLLMNRTCSLAPVCISSATGEIVQFIMAGGIGGVAETNKRFHETERLKSAQKVQMTCITMADVLHRFGVKHVDLLSLDVEGHELAVLKGVDLSTVKIDFIFMEPNSQESADYLRNAGYRNVWEELWIRNGVQLERERQGKPLILPTSAVL